MHGTAAGLRDATGLSALAARHPELRPWLGPLALALDAAAREPWPGLIPVLAEDTGDAPLLHGALLPLDPSALAALIHAILGETGLEHRRGTVDPAALLEAAIAHDDAAVEALAIRAHIEPERLAAVGQLAALPALQACGRALERALPRTWTRGHCPVCGALPTLVEVRGLERARALRCARCGAGWSTEVLLCAFCGERAHERLGSLVPEGGEGRTRWVETCAGCGGYLKALATLRGLAPAGVIVEDASSVHLDLAAVERGFRRPRRPGCAVRVRLVPARVRA